MIKTKVDACDILISEYNYMIVRKELDIKMMTAMQIITTVDENNPSTKKDIGTLGKQVQKLKGLVKMLVDMRKEYIKEKEQYV
jgi:hypothetical protein